MVTDGQGQKGGREEDVRNTKLEGKREEQKRGSMNPEGASLKTIQAA